MKVGGDDLELYLRRFLRVTLLELQKKYYLRCLGFVHLLSKGPFINDVTQKNDFFDPPSPPPFVTNFPKKQKKIVFGLSQILQPPHSKA